LTDVVHEGQAFHQLHREEAQAVLDHEVVERDQVRVRRVREIPELALQLIDVVGAPAPQRLQGHDLSAIAILHLVDDAHATGADPAPHRVAGRAGKVVGQLGARLGEKSGRRQRQGNAVNVLERVERDAGAVHQQSGLFEEVRRLERRRQERFDFDAGPAVGAAQSGHIARAVRGGPGQGARHDVLQPRVVTAVHCSCPSARAGTLLYALSR
jgi:hypothetical protein